MNFDYNIGPNSLIFYKQIDIQAWNMNDTIYLDSYISITTTKNSVEFTVHINPNAPNY